MTTLTERTKNLVDQEIPFECANCPFVQPEGRGRYRCGLVGKTASQINSNPECLGERVSVVDRQHKMGEIAVVRVEGGTVHFKVAMDDGSLANVRCDECELA